MIKVVTFDFGGVLGSDVDEWDKAFKEIPKLTGLSPQELEEVFDKHWPMLKIGEESLRIFWKDVSTKSKYKVDPEKLGEIYNNSVAANQEMLEFVKNLKGKYRTVILMNESDEGGRAKVQKFKLKEIFDKVYSSAEMGFGKPNKEIFEYVLKDLNIKPSELIFIDNQENNIEVAKKIGILTLLFQNYTRLIEDFEKLGIVRRPT